MLTRRHLLSGIALGGIVATLGRSSAFAINLEPMPKPLGDLAMGVRLATSSWPLRQRR